MMIKYNVKVLIFCRKRYLTGKVLFIRRYPNNKYKQTIIWRYPWTVCVWSAAISQYLCIGSKFSFCFFFVYQFRQTLNFYITISANKLENAEVAAWIKSPSSLFAPVLTIYRERENHRFILVVKIPNCYCSSVGVMGVLTGGGGSWDSTSPFPQFMLEVHCYEFFFHALG